MSSGRRKRIMIACVTFEVAKIVDPAIFYEVNRIHILHYVRDPVSDTGKVYTEFYDRVVELLREKSSLDIEIVEHSDVKVYDFSEVLCRVSSIIRAENAEEPGCEIYVNISAGTSEFAAAATIASMMVPGTTPFSVGIMDYTIYGDRVREVFYEDGKPVGMAKSVRNPKTLPSYAIEMPEEHLVRALRVLKDRADAKLSTTSGNMIQSLKDKGIWYRDVNPPEDSKSSKRQAEAVYYQRDFITKWLNHGWIEKDRLSGKYVLSERGKIIVSTFYVDRGNKDYSNNK